MYHSNVLLLSPHEALRPPAPPAGRTHVPAATSRPGGTASSRPRLQARPQAGSQGRSLTPLRGQAQASSQAPSQTEAGARGLTRRPAASRQAWHQAASPAQEAALWQNLMPHLPGNVRQLWLCLQDAAQLRRVLEAYGGQELRVPRALPASGHELRRTLGLSCLRRLIAMMGGTRIYVPRCAALLNKLRQREIITSFSRQTASGHSSTATVARLARRHGLSDRRIWQILKQEASLPAGAQLLTSLRGDSSAGKP